MVPFKDKGVISFWIDQSDRDNKLCIFTQNKDIVVVHVKLDHIMLKKVNLGYFFRSL